ncbi:MAG TPA: succinate dehydrogenase cytochrome b subunit [Vicinamibacteria bacterium]|nr:succinate dehydrogenase cytochrome b subunit [Vicinamibacteria bacterium]
MNALLALLRSSIGRKAIMAVTGVALFGFVLAHMAGNMQAFAGPTKLDEYGAALRRVPPLLWTFRLGLLGAALLHVWAAASLTLTSRGARACGYRSLAPQDSTYASRSMRLSGVVLLVFIVYHVLHFTLGSAHPDFVEGAVTHNVVTGFNVIWVTGFYFLAMACLGLHLWHGVWSMTQTFGLAHPRYDALRENAATAFTLLVVLGFLAVPVGVLAGLIQEAHPVAAQAAVAR